MGEYDDLSGDDIATSMQGEPEGRGNMVADPQHQRISVEEYFKLDQEGGSKQWRPIRNEHTTPLENI